MLKYADVLETFTEIPDEWALCINIADCPCHCKGCHSPWLWEGYKGDVKLHNLESKDLEELIKKHKGISCVAFMGGDSEPKEVYKLCKEVKLIYNLRTAWYSGRQDLPDFIKGQKLSRYDYIKLGPYNEDLGGLDNPKTNQKLYEVCRLSKLPDVFCLNDITSKFWKN